MSDKAVKVLLSEIIWRLQVQSQPMVRIARNIYETYEGLFHRCGEWLVLFVNSEVCNLTPFLLLTLFTCFLFSVEAEKELRTKRETRIPLNFYFGGLR